MARTARFYSVSVVADYWDDPGFTVTFDNLPEAERYRDWALDQGMFFVSPIWS